MPKKSFAEKMDIPRGVGGILHNGVRICKKNKISPFVYREAGVKTLLTALHRFQSEGRNVVLYGIWTNNRSHKFKFALYEQAELTKRELRSMIEDYEQYKDVEGCEEFFADLVEQEAEPRRQQ